MYVGAELYTSTVWEYTSLVNQPVFLRAHVRVRKNRLVHETRSIHV